MAKEFCEQKKTEIERPDSQDSAQIKRLYVNRSGSGFFPAQQFGNKIRTQKEKKAQAICADGCNNWLKGNRARAHRKRMYVKNSQECDQAKDIQLRPIEARCGGFFICRWICMKRQRIRGGGGQWRLLSLASPTRSFENGIARSEQPIDSCRTVLHN